MLYKKFEFITAFSILDKGEFGKYNNVEYFGKTEHNNSIPEEEVEVHYYNSQDDFAILVNTKTDDELIYCKNPNGRNFNEINEYVTKKAGKYDGDKNISSSDEIKIPKLNINETREYQEIEGQHIINFEDLFISRALQTVELTIDEKGGVIRSEAAIGTKSVSYADSKTNDARYFY